MDPIDFRNTTWSAIKERMAGMRLQVYYAWLRHGPGTTRAVSDRSGIDILTFRPRTTELFDLGFVRLVPDPASKRRGAVSEGIYRAVSWDEAKTEFEEKRRAALSFQPELQLGRLATPTQ